MNPPNPQQLEAQCGQWNSQHPAGTAITVRLDNGSLMETKTRSEAWVMGGHSAVILVDGISGSYRLDRCTPIRQPQIPTLPV